MTQRSRGVVLLVVQLVLVLSIAGKYVYERKVCPRVWVRTAQFDPDLPFRGRYLALRLAVGVVSVLMKLGEGGVVGSNGFVRWFETEKRWHTGLRER